MKFKIFMMSLALAVSVVAMAQPGGGRRGGDPTQRAEMQSQMMVDSLSLSAPQAEKVKEINLKYAQKQQEVRANTPDGEWDKMRAALEALRNEQNTELKTVLNKDQFERWQKIAEAQFSKGRGRGGVPPPQDADKKGKGKKGKKGDAQVPPPPPPAPATGGGNR